jgi:hypothetical protein
MLLAALVRSRRAYADEVRQRLRLAEEERRHDAERRVAQERLRIVSARQQMAGRRSP